MPAVPQQKIPDTAVIEALGRILSGAGQYKRASGGADVLSYDVHAEIARVVLVFCQQYGAEE